MIEKIKPIKGIGNNDKQQYKYNQYDKYKRRSGWWGEAWATTYADWECKFPVFFCKKIFYVDEALDEQWDIWQNVSFFILLDTQ